MTNRLTGNLILPDRILRGATLCWDGGRITGIEPSSGAVTEELPCLCPGFVDMHNHGALGYDYMDCRAESMDAIAAYLASHGVTSSQPTTVTAPVENILDFLRFYRGYCQDDSGGCRFVGVHLEGPFLSPINAGAQPSGDLRTPADGYGWILDNADLVSEVTVAPDLAGMPGMIRDLRAAGITVAGGHDGSEPADIDAAFAAGLTHGTHIYCAMSTLHKDAAGTRRYGLVEALLADPDRTVEMIADGQHVPVPLAQLIYRCKGAAHVALVSDAISPAGLPVSNTVYRLGKGANATRVILTEEVAMVEDRSHYAGSIQPIDRMVRRLVQEGGIPLPDAVRMASLTPAEIIGIDADCGSLAVGKRADFTVLDSRLNVRETFVGGRPVWKAKEEN